MVLEIKADNNSGGTAWKLLTLCALIWLAYGICIACFPTLSADMQHRFFVCLHACDIVIGLNKLLRTIQTYNFFL